MYPWVQLTHGWPSCRLEPHPGTCTKLPLPSPSLDPHPGPDLLSADSPFGESKSPGEIKKSVSALGRRGHLVSFSSAAPTPPHLYPFSARPSAAGKSRRAKSLPPLPSSAMGEDSELLRPHFWGLSEVWRVNPKTGGPGTFLNRCGRTSLPRDRLVFGSGLSFWWPVQAGDSKGFSWCAGAERPRRLPPPKNRTENHTSPPFRPWLRGGFESRERIF